MPLEADTGARSPLTVPTWQRWGAAPGDPPRREEDPDWGSARRRARPGEDCFQAPKTLREASLCSSGGRSQARLEAASLFAKNPLVPDPPPLRPQTVYSGTEAPPLAPRGGPEFGAVLATPVSAPTAPARVLSWSMSAGRGKRLPSTTVQITQVWTRRDSTAFLSDKAMSHVSVREAPPGSPLPPLSAGGAGPGRRLCPLPSCAEAPPGPCALAPAEPLPCSGARPSEHDGEAPSAGPGAQVPAATPASRLTGQDGHCPRRPCAPPAPSVQRGGPLGGGSVGVRPAWMHPADWSQDGSTVSGGQT